TELRNYRVKPFLDDDFTGIRPFQKELVEILRKEDFVSNDEILTRLGIKPSEHETIKGISKVLEILKAYELIRYSPKGWRWIR
ncbi:MAG: hypothetical protein ACXABK_04625, partial [Candidatus Heimdallarchaeaceae archaeon]